MQRSALPSSTAPTPRPRRRTLSTIALVALSTAALTVGCGGSTPSEAKSPNAANAANSAPKDSADPASATADATDPGPTTTTTELGEGGDLQGAKLTTSSSKKIETKGPSGPKAGPGHKSEPGRGAKDVRTIIMARRDQARACYDKALEQHPGIEGDLDIKWVIDPEGNVTEIEVDTMKSQIHEPSVGKCIIDVIKKIKFAPSAKGFETRTHYPFNFHPHQGGRSRHKTGH